MLKFKTRYESQEPDILIERYNLSLRKHLKKTIVLLRAGHSIEEVAAVTRQRENIVARIQHHFVCEVYKETKLGSKKESYFTEEELLNPFPTYTFKELSREEKKIYNNLVKRKLRL